MLSNNDEFKMLCLAISDMKSGFCLMKCDDECRQLDTAYAVCSDINKTSLVIDIAALDVRNIPDDTYNLRKLLDQGKLAQVVFLCNLHECSKVLGDYEFIERFNAMRDIMIAMNKIWVFGVTSEFATKLSCKARDLYSCILNHFDFSSKCR